MDLRDLRYFVAVAKSRSLSRGAAAARVAQPALSRRVRALERELGVALLVRHAKGVVLTPAGVSLAQGGERLLADTAAALDRAEATAAGRRGRVVLGATRAVIARGLPTAVQDSLRRDHPEIGLIIHDIEPPDTWEAVVEQRSDVGLCVEHAPLPALVAETLWMERMDQAIVPSDHPLATRSTVSLADLGALPLLVSPRTVDPARVAGITQTVQQAGLRSPVVYVDGDLRAVHLAVAAGRGWTLMTRARAQAPPEGTVAVRVDGISILMRVTVVWRRGENRAVVRTVVRRILELARGYPDTAVRPEPALPRTLWRRPVRRPPGTVPPGVDLRHLSALATVAELGTIGRAAERQRITQPALSRRLGELERTLGIDLLQRSSRGVTLTPAGVALVADTPPLLALAEHLRDETTRSRRSMEGRCVIGAVATAASSALLTRVVRTCAARLPHVQLVVEEMPTPSQPVALEQGAIDLGLAHAFPATAHRRGTSIVVTRVHSDRLDSVLLPAAHPLGARSRIDARDLAELPFLFMARGFHPGFYDRVFAALGKLRLVPRVDATYDGLQTVWALTAQGMGWTLGFHSQRRHPPAGTVAVPIVGFDLPWGLDLLSRRGEPSGAVSAVIKLFRDAGRSKRRG